MRWSQLVVVLVTACAVLALASNDPIHIEVPARAQIDLAITVYNRGTGLVIDTRRLELPAGVSEVSFRDVSREVDTKSVHVRNVSPGGARVRVLEQNFLYDVVNQQTLMQKHVGKDVTLVLARGAEAERETTTVQLLSFDGMQSVFRFPDGTVSSHPDGLMEVRFPELPESLMVRPTLVWLVESEVAQVVDLEVSYLTQGMSWSADHVLVADGKFDEIGSLESWVTIQNYGTEVTFTNARLKLMAGDINAPQPKLEYDMFTAEAGAPMRAGMMSDSAGFSDKSFSEFYLYSLGRRTTLKQKEQKQISLHSAEGIEMEKVMLVHTNRYTRNEKLGVDVVLRFNNTKANNLGMALPAGDVRVYKRDSDGSLQWIGSDHIEHTPREEELELNLGKAFDIVANRKLVAERQMANNVYEYSAEIVLRNRKTEEGVVKVEIREDVYSPNFVVLASSHSWDKVSSKVLETEVTLASDQEEVITVSFRIDDSGMYRK